MTESNRRQHRNIEIRTLRILDTSVNNEMIPINHHFINKISQVDIRVDYVYLYQLRMKARRIHRITALIMAFLMFFASVGFSVDFHYCKGELKSFSLIGEASACHKEMKTCPRHAEMQTVEDNEDSKCCSNETVVVDDIDVDYNLTSSFELTDLQVKIVSAFVYSFSGNILPEVIQNTRFKKQPPLLTRDIYVLLERFLI